MFNVFSARLGSRLARLGNILLGFNGLPFNADLVINANIALQTATKFNLNASFKPKIALKSTQNQLNLTNKNSKLVLNTINNSFNLRKINRLTKF